MIQQRTGHRSLDALRLYEQSSTKQQQAVSEIVNPMTENFRYEDIASGTTKDTIVSSSNQTVSSPNGFVPSSCSNCTINLTINTGGQS